jgi:CHAT domain-containing protein/Tfp pilus assembly protein PilF
MNDILSRMWQILAWCLSIAALISCSTAPLGAQDTDDYRDHVRKTSRLIIAGKHEEALQAIRARQGESPRDRAAQDLLEGLIQSTLKDGKSPEPHWKSSLQAFRHCGDEWGEGVTLMRWGTYLREKGDLEGGERLLLQSEGLLGREKEWTLRGAAFMELFSIYSASGTPEKVDYALREALENFGRAKDSLRMSGAYYRWSYYYYQREDYQKSLAYSLKAIEAVRCAGNDAVLAQFLLHHGNTLLTMARGEEAIEYLSKGIDLPTRDETKATLYSVRGDAFLSIRRCEKAAEDYERALALYHSLGLAENAAHVQHMMGEAYFGAGDQAQARASYMKTLEACRILKDNKGEAQAHASLGELFIAGGETDEGFREYEKALGLAGEDLPLKAWCLSRLGMQWRLQGEYGKAEDALRKSIDLFDSPGSHASPADLAYALTSLGGLYGETGNVEKAKVLIGRALLVSRNGHYPQGEIQAGESLASLAIKAGNFRDASRMLCESLGIAEKSSDKASIALLHSYMGQCFEEQGLIDDAKVHYQESLRLNEACSLKKAEASDHINLGFMAFYHEGDAEAAETEYRKALKLFQDINDCAGVIRSLRFLASLEKQKGNGQKALALYDEALEKAGKSRLISDELCTRFLKGHYYIERGDYATGQKILEDCAQEYQRRHMDSDLADTLLSNGMIYLNNFGDIEKARHRIGRARSIYERKGDKGGIYACRLAELEMKMESSHYDEGAKDLYSLIDEVKGAHSAQLYCDALHLLAYYSFNAGKNPERALGYLREAMMTAQTWASVHQQLDLRNAIASILIGAGENDPRHLAEAERLLLQSRAAAENLKSPRLLATTYIKLAWIYGAQGKKENAKECLQKALKTPDMDCRLLALEGMLSEYVREKDYDRAREVEKTLSEMLPAIQNIKYRSQILKYLYTASYAHNDFHRASGYLEQKMAIDARHNPEFWQCENYFKAGILCEKGGDWRKALDYYRKSAESGEKVLGYMKIEESRRERTNLPLAFKDSEQHGEPLTPYGGAIRLLVEKEDVREAFQFCERDHARTFLQSIGNNAWPPLPERKINQKIMQNIEHMQHYANLLKALKKNIDADPGSMAGEMAPSLTRSLPGHLRGDENPGGARKEDMAFLDASRDKLMQEIPSELIRQYKEKYMEVLPLLKIEAPDYYSIKSVSPAPLSQIQALLDRDSLLIEYYLESDRLFIFSVTSSALKACSMPCSSSGLAGMIGSFRRQISRESGERGAGYSPGLNEQARALYRLLIEPVELSLKAKTRIVLVPHRQLHYLPFAALVDSEGNPLARRFALVHLPSSSTLPLCRGTSKGRRIDASPRLVSFALGKVTSGNFSALPGTKIEAQKIAAIFPQSSLWMENDFVKERIIEKSADAHYVHLATHGVLDPEYPYFSGLVTADGIFRLSDIFNSLRLRNCTLVTISACQTALGSLSPGDDLVGFSRAFIYAGAPTVVSSLWSVSDESTVSLMETFYANLRKGMPKDVALQRAQMTLMEHFPQPYHWASFILIGDWETF